MAKHIAVAIGSRANWGSCKAVCAELTKRDVRLTIICYASALSPLHGEVVNEIRGLHEVVEGPPMCVGSSHRDMATTSGAVMLGVAQILDRLKPDVLYVVGDRYEVLPAAYCAALMNVRVAHQMGGEVSGTIDESVRHAITKLSHVHFAATEQAAARLLSMGELSGTVHMTGCPRIDLAAQLSPPIEATVPPIVLMHPVTTESDQSRVVVAALLATWRAFGKRFDVFWPNVDSGHDELIRAIKMAPSEMQFSTHRNVSPEIWMRAMRGTVCVVGNSSSAIREGAFLGTPAVNIGTRQQFRERGPNVIDVPWRDVHVLEDAIRTQIRHGRYASSSIYGAGTAARKISDVLENQELPGVQKQCAF